MGFHYLDLVFMKIVIASPETAQQKSKGSSQSQNPRLSKSDARVCMCTRFILLLVRINITTQNQVQKIKRNNDCDIFAVKAIKQFIK